MTGNMNTKEDANETKVKQGEKKKNCVAFDQKRKENIQKLCFQTSRVCSIRLKCTQLPLPLLYMSLNVLLFEGLSQTNKDLFPLFFENKIQKHREKKENLSIGMLTSK